MDISILVYIIIFLILIIILWIFLIELRIKKFFIGTKTQNLEEVMVNLKKDVLQIKRDQIQTTQHLEVVDSRLDKSIRKIKTIRFNPFVDAGSNQSFAISFLNDEKDGVVISSLYARDRMSIFAKPINKGVSDFELSDEEKKVLEESK
jgi:hypothetical protein